MKTPHESVNAPTASRNDIRKGNPRLRRIHDPRLRNGMIVYANSTR
jgi:hypothetical protein